MPNYLLRQVFTYHSYGLRTFLILHQPQSWSIQVCVWYSQCRF